MTAPPAVSVIVLNLNGRECLSECIDSVLRSRFVDFELILVDNGSTDSSALAAKAQYAQDRRVRVIENGVNLGCAGGCNAGIQAARGGILVVLGNDTVVAESWLDHVVPLFASDPGIGAAQGKLVSYWDPVLLDGTGCFIDWHGCPRERGGAFLKQSAERDSQTTADIEDIFACGLTCMFLRREAVQRAGAFDDDFFVFCEDLDLSWRIRLAGYRIVLVPDCVVRHKRSQTARKYSASTLGWHFHKNKMSMCLKNMGPVSLLKALPALLLLLGVRSLYGLLVLRSTSEAYSPLKGLLWNLRHLPATLRKRTHIQRSVRRVAEREMALWFAERCFLHSDSRPVEWPSPAWSAPGAGQ